MYDFDVEENISELCKETSDNLDIIMRTTALDLSDAKFRLFSKVATELELFYRLSGGDK